eukprot:403341831
MEDIAQTSAIKRNSQDNLNYLDEQYPSSPASNPLQKPQLPSPIDQLPFEMQPKQNNLQSNNSNPLIQVINNNQNQIQNSSSRQYIQNQIDSSSQIDSESYRIVFDLFDRDRSGCIDNGDLQEISKALNRDPEEVIELVQSFDPNNDGKIAFNEFIQVMQALESRVNAENTSNSQSVNEEKKKAFGKMLPIGVNFLPDTKILEFLRLLNDYQKKCEKDLQYIPAKKAREKFQLLAQREMERQQRNMQFSQKTELELIEQSQQQQFLEFSAAWDQYMSDYEAAAYKSLEKLKQKHDDEIVQLQIVMKEQNPVKYNLSKELMELRNFEKKHFALKEYDKAEHFKKQADRMEAEERSKCDQQAQDKIDREVTKLRGKQQSALNSLLKRIQRDRDEQLKHRAQDSQRLIQRNRNILQDVIARQQLEAKKTTEFLKYSLGKRSPQKPHNSNINSSGISHNQSQLSIRQLGDGVSNYKMPLIRSVINGQRNHNEIYKTPVSEDKLQNHLDNNVSQDDVGDVSVFLTSQPLSQEEDYLQKQLKIADQQSSALRTPTTYANTNTNRQQQHQHAMSVGRQQQNSIVKSQIGRHNLNQSEHDISPLNLSSSFSKRQTDQLNASITGAGQINSGSHSTHRSFQVTETVAQNFKKMQKMQLNMQRYGMMSNNDYTSPTQQYNSSIRNSAKKYYNLSRVSPIQQQSNINQQQLNNSGSKLPSGVGVQNQSNDIQQQQQSFDYQMVSNTNNQQTTQPLRAQSLLSQQNQMKKIQLLNTGNAIIGGGANDTSKVQQNINNDQRVSRFDQQQQLL